MSDAITPLQVYGVEPSYFTGKLEAYLRYKEIPYEFVVCSPDDLKQATGVGQVPGLKLADGRWMTDTTPILAWLETQFPDPVVLPADPLQRFVSLLIEDYADEWLWRPAMHYRWYYPGDAYLLSRKLVDEAAGHVPLPGFLKRFWVRTRQRRYFTRGDGVTEKTKPHVEATYHTALQQLEAIFENRPYLLGDVPTIADFGFFGPMFRHFNNDPTAARIMRDEASGVNEWVARLWNARASRTKGGLVAGIPDDWTPLLRSIGSSYLPYLAVNAEAFRTKQEKVSVEVEGTRYEDLRVAPYRVWCLERLQREYAGLPPDIAVEAKALLERHGCWEPLFRAGDVQSGIDPDGRAPFVGAGSMTGLSSIALPGEPWARPAE